MIKSELLSITDYFVKNLKPEQMKWHYEYGLLIYSVLAVGRGCGTEEYLPWAYSLYDPLIDRHGNIAGYSEGEHNLDQINAGKALFDLYFNYHEERFFLALEKLEHQLEIQPRCLCGVYWHKEKCPYQIWIDGFYMQAPFHIRFAHEFLKNGKIYEDEVGMFLKAYEIMKDGGSGLIFHAFDESRGQRWSDINTGLSQNIWGRSVGWYLMAIIDSLDFLPGNTENIGLLKTVFKDIIDSLLRFQDESGLWHQVVTQPSREHNYLEVSCSSMFAYCMLKASRNKILKGQKYVDSAIKAINGIKNGYLSCEGKRYELKGICSVAALGGNPYRDGSYEYYVSEPAKTNDFKGVGPFLLALLELEKLS